MSKENIRSAIEEVSGQWEEEDFPDDFSATAQIDGQSLYVNIQHHETFPMGGRSYDVYVRDGPEETSNLLAKERVKVIMGFMFLP